MAKAKMLGYQKPYTPNRRADQRYRPRSALRNKNIIDDRAGPIGEQRREEKKLRDLKRAKEDAGDGT